MASFTRAELNRLLHLVSEINYCVGTEDAILNHYYSEDGRDERYLMEEYAGVNDGRSYPEYTLDAIQEELDKHGLVGVRMENGTGGAMDQTFNHHFILYRADGQVYRIESYVFLYCSRILETPTWREDLYRLLTAPPGPQRLSLWNSLFSARETSDQPLPLDVVLDRRREVD